MKIVLDTNVLVSATMWDNSVAQKFLFRCVEGNVQIFSSPEIIEEYKEILAREFKYEEQKIGEILQKILKSITLIVPSTKIDAVKNDADDNKIIECALESKSDYIVSYDNHLLKLKDYQGIKITRPEEAFGLIFGA